VFSHSVRAGVASQHAHIFDIKRFALHDGPGIRTTVFFKGCPLTCQWCHNPESQSTRPQLLFDRAACVGCGGCVEACPEGAVKMRAERPAVDVDLCRVCGACVEACLRGARSIVGQTVSIDQILQVVIADEVFYAESGGGVTLSGGEPLLQPEAAEGLLSACKARGLHTALDTSGQGAAGDIRRLIPMVDLFLFDLKSADPVRHVEGTGCPSDSIVENARIVDASGTPIWVRIPVIPGWNDSLEELENLCRLASTMTHVEAVHLLPYHRGGVHKWDRLGAEAPFATSPVSRAEIEAIRGKLQPLLSVPVLVGG